MNEGIYYQTRCAASIRRSTEERRPKLHVSLPAQAPDRTFDLRNKRKLCTLSSHQIADMFSAHAPQLTQKEGLLHTIRHHIKSKTNNNKTDAPTNFPYALCLRTNSQDICVASETNNEIRLGSVYVPRPDRSSCGCWCCYVKNTCSCRYFCDEAQAVAGVRTNS